MEGDIVLGTRSREMCPMGMKGLPRQRWGGTVASAVSIKGSFSRGKRSVWDCISCCCVDFGLGFMV
jgi:hypothetical protein